MKLKASYLRKVFTDEGDIEITFKVDDRYQLMLSSLLKQEYAVTISKSTNDRSIQQNSLMWALLDEISKKQDGYRADRYETYLQLLRKAKAKTVEFGCVAEAMDEIIKAADYRGHRVLSTYEQNGRRMYWIEAYVGSSKMTTKEMTDLIDTAMDWASELGIDTTYYEDQMRGVPYDY